MKPLLALIVGLLAVGCVTLTPEEKQKRLRDSVVGEYEFERTKNILGGAGRYKYVFLENGAWEHYKFSNNTKTEGSKWVISNGKLHVFNNEGFTMIYRIHSDKSITYIAVIDDEKRRTDFSKEKQYTFKKIK